ncbi:hypothetical protein [Streptomyces sp. S.PNR 29]|uniref:hypothetical protein n=1 Tax=Streptomyces sp. S.PNR 29 TaxID=2973805 RepID=UPI0025B2066C|nr:hypothetical protein [Streptomyces sp. S.PNR 29]MDN0201115.1 hypothetical protein [Streptomyces sp. S.PNR 29]
MIAILTSGATLGVHVPGLLLADRLREQHMTAEVHVLERLLPQEKLATMGDMKWAYHRSFRFALAGRRMERDTGLDLDEGAVRQQWKEWQERGVRHFVVLSGYWLSMLRGFREFIGEPIGVDLCRGDAAPMQSFLLGGDPPPEGAREINLADGERGVLPWTIPVSRKPPVPWAEREQRILAHGGGWGLGTYRERADELSRHHFGLDLVTYESADVKDERPGVRHFMIDPQWHPWHDNGYPPFARIDPAVGASGAEFTRRTEYPHAFDLARNGVAIMSKPGAGTLLDSLWAATPLIVLEAWSDSEKLNGELWRKLGFGITFEDWQATGFSPDVLAELHENLLPAARSTSDYSAALAAQLAEEGSVVT